MDRPQAFKSVSRKATKRHQCCECAQTIYEGQTYLYISGIWDGTPDSFKQCSSCASVFDAAVSFATEADEEPLIGGLHEWISNEADNYDNNHLGLAIELMVPLRKLNKITRHKGQSCGFQVGTIECRGDGYLWDADHEGYDPNDLSMPCPHCNPLEHLESQKEDAESTSTFDYGYASGTGVTLWEKAVEEFRKLHSNDADRYLKLIGEVNALDYDPKQPDKELTVRFTY